jgi:hypothetical protein
LRFFDLKGFLYFGSKQHGVAALDEGRVEGIEITFDSSSSASRKNGEVFFLPP